MYISVNSDCLEMLKTNIPHICIANLAKVKCKENIPLQQPIESFNMLELRT